MGLPIASRQHAQSFVSWAAIDAFATFALTSYASSEVRELVQAPQPSASDHATCESRLAELGTRVRGVRAVASYSAQHSTPRRRALGVAYWARRAMIATRTERRERAIWRLAEAVQSGE